MKKAMELAEQRILEAESRLRRIDEAMVQARSAPVDAAKSDETDLLLKQIEADRNRLARELDDVRSMVRDAASNAAVRGEGLKGMLEATGRQMEKVLATVFDKAR